MGRSYLLAQWRRDVLNRLPAQPKPRPDHPAWPVTLDAPVLDWHDGSGYQRGTCKCGARVIRRYGPGNVIVADWRHEEE
jgi:hypothetical protein